jgi:ABC-type amino acid transport substrate-binding protein
VPDTTVTKWQQALDTLKESGRYQALSLKYLHQQ